MKYSQVNLREEYAAFSRLRISLKLFPLEMLGNFSPFRAIALDLSRAAKGTPMAVATHCAYVLSHLYEARLMLCDLPGHTQLDVAIRCLERYLARAEEAIEHELGGSSL